ncbi:MAG TPA: hypothetical protein VHA56_09560 [Mucilaginibacter sp.]|nr:hypothetical protein [Mucilaginibacter sp.]
MITGAHTIIYSSDVSADIEFFKNILGFDNVDAGGGWLIFRLPPAELAIHPAEVNGPHVLYLMCDNIVLFIEEMKGHNIHCGPVDEQRWGSVTTLTLPGGGKIGVYEPKHVRP